MNTLIRRVMYPTGNMPEMPGISMSSKFIEWEPLLLWSLLLLIWFVTPGWLRYIDPTVAVPDNGIWLLIILSLIVFLILLRLCFWLIYRRLLWKNQSLERGLLNSNVALKLATTGLFVKEPG